MNLVYAGKMNKRLTGRIGFAAAHILIAEGHQRNSPDHFHGDWKDVASSHRHGRACSGHDGEDTIPVTANAL
jgi:hypothetical protein